MQLTTIHSTVSAKTAIKNLFKKEQLLAKQETDLNIEKITYHEDIEKKKQPVQNSYHA